MKETNMVISLYTGLQVMVAIAVSASTALTSGYAKYLMSKFDNEIKEIKERQDVMEGRQSLTEGWQNVGLQSIRIHNALS